MRDLDAIEAQLERVRRSLLDEADSEMRDGLLYAVGRRLDEIEKARKKPPSRWIMTYDADETKLREMITEKTGKDTADGKVRLNRRKRETAREWTLLGADPGDLETAMAEIIESGKITPIHRRKKRRDGQALDGVTWIEPE